MNRTTAIVGGVVAAGGLGYLAYAYAKCKFPFENVGKCKTGGGVTVPNPPGQPTLSQPRLIDQNTAEIDVSWNAVPMATYYKVFANGSPVAGAENVQGTSVTIRVAPGQTYNIAVAACN
jgi:hypothetical protein